MGSIHGDQDGQHSLGVTGRADTVGFHPDQSVNPDCRSSTTVCCLVVQHRALGCQGPHTLVVPSSSPPRPGIRWYVLHVSSSRLCPLSPPLPAARNGRSSPTTQLDPRAPPRRPRGDGGTFAAPPPPWPPVLNSLPRQHRSARTKVVTKRASHIATWGTRPSPMCECPRVPSPPPAVGPRASTVRARLQAACGAG
jgi:hypothetical protein